MKKRSNTRSKLIDFEKEKLNEIGFRKKSENN